MPADGAYVSDVFSDFATWYYSWNDHDSGVGFLTVARAANRLERALVLTSTRSPLQK